MAKDEKKMEEKAPAAAEAIETKKEETKKISTKATRAKAIDTKAGKVKAIEDKRPDKKSPNRGKKHAAEKTEETYIQYAGYQFQVEAIVERVKQAYVAEGHRTSSIHSLQVYIKPEEGVAYYVINGKSEGKSVPLGE